MAWLHNRTVFFYLRLLVLFDELAFAYGHGYHPRVLRTRACAGLLILTVWGLAPTPSTNASHVHEGNESAGRGSNLARNPLPIWTLALRSSVSQPLRTPFSISSTLAG
jgi:hypothetical protein